MNVTGRTIVVTGASRGIGRATAQAFARAGGRTALLARSPEIREVATELVAQGANARGYIVDLTDPAAVEQTAQRVVNELGEPDIVVNNAGAGRWLYVEETPSAEAATMIASPYLAAFYVTRAFLPAMLARGEGYIVNVNSPAAWLPWPGAAGYMAARWAMRGFTAALRADLRDTGIQVLQIVPGKVSSTYFEHNPRSEERIPRIAQWVPTLTPEQVAATLVRGVERDRREIMLPAILKGVIVARAVAPAVVDWLMFRTGARRRPRADSSLTQPSCSDRRPPA
jgi:short-subunit dehydrogenase